MLSPTVLVGILAPMILLVIIAFVLISTFKKCGPNQAMIISGMLTGEAGRSYKIVVGGGSVLMPLIQQVHFLSMEVIKTDIFGQTPFITRDGIPLYVDGVAQVKVKGDAVSIATAAEVLMGKTDAEISIIAQDLFISNMRAVVGTLTFEELNSNLLATAMKVEEITISELAKMGLAVVSFKLKELRKVTEATR